MHSLSEVKLPENKLAVDFNSQFNHLAFYWRLDLSRSETPEELAKKELVFNELLESKEINTVIKLDHLQRLLDELSNLGFTSFFTPGCRASIAFGKYLSLLEKLLSKSASHLLISELLDFAMDRNVDPQVLKVLLKIAPHILTEAHLFKALRENKIHFIDFFVTGYSIPIHDISQLHNVFKKIFTKEEAYSSQKEPLLMKLPQIKNYIKKDAFFMTHTLNASSFDEAKIKLLIQIEAKFTCSHLDTVANKFYSPYDILPHLEKNIEIEKKTQAERAKKLSCLLEHKDIKKILNPGHVTILTAGLADSDLLDQVLRVPDSVDITDEFTFACMFRFLRFNDSKSADLFKQVFAVYLSNIEPAGEKTIEDKTMKDNRLYEDEDKFSFIEKMFSLGVRNTHTELFNAMLPHLESGNPTFLSIAIKAKHVPFITALIDDKKMKVTEKHLYHFLKNAFGSFDVFKKLLEQLSPHDLSAEHLRLAISPWQEEFLPLLFARNVPIDNSHINKVMEEKSITTRQSHLVYLSNHPGLAKTPLILQAVLKTVLTPVEPNASLFSSPSLTFSESDCKKVASLIEKGATLAKEIFDDVFESKLEPKHQNTLVNYLFKINLTENPDQKAIILYGLQKLLNKMKGNELFQCLILFLRFFTQHSIVIPTDLQMQIEKIISLVPATESATQCLLKWTEYRESIAKVNPSLGEERKESITLSF